jgi:hypothetical protein
MKTLSTTEAIGAELDSLYEQLETGDMDGEDARSLTMKLAVLRQRADLIKNNVMEQKLDQLEKLVEQKLAGSHLRRVV